MQALSYRRILLLTAAVALSLATAMIVRAWVNEARLSAVATGTADVPKQQVTKVLVATHGLPAGQFLQPNDLEWQEWPDNALNSSYIASGSRTIDDLVGSVVRAAISGGEPITDDRLIKKGDRGFLSAIMSPGTRAVTVQLQQNAGLGGLVLPGDHVDVVLTAVVPAGGPNQPEHHASETVLEDIRVIAIDQKMSDMSNETVMARSATLEVLPKQAEILALVTDMGKLSLTLRSIASGDEKPRTTNSKGEPTEPSVIWDNEATNLGLKPHNVSSGDSAAKVDLVRGGSTKSFEFSKDGK
ncbi:MAG TPA: Flp pilus assembly protein CpaB [Stellaceae bacterium]|jgi:pilus assembly protein CpaB|nr:Flp pilus assembly protein CpaB [Stellaceae bacterium]